MKIPEAQISMQRRITSEPWCILPDTLEFLSRLSFREGIIEPPRSEAWARSPGGYSALNDEGRQATNLPDAPGGFHVTLAWGMLGRAWSAAEKFWMDAIDVDDLVDDIEQAQEKNIIIWFRSPGGVSSGMPEAVEAIRSLSAKKNIIAFTDDLMASAAYWLGSAADSIVATPTAQVGSIGVYTAFYDYSRMIENAGISLELFKAGRLKAMGIPGKALSEEERQLIQDRVDMVYEDFTSSILERRDLASETMQGQTFSGRDAQDRKLIDRQVPSARSFFSSLNSRGI